MILFQAFRCVGCDQPSSKPNLCQFCRESIRFNSDFIVSTVSNIKFFAPLFYSFGTTHSIFKAWKNHPGKLIENQILVFPPQLQRSLQNLRLDAIVPIPQQKSRSWKRGHASAYSAATFFSKKLSVPICDSLILRSSTDDLFEQRQTHLHGYDRTFSENPFSLIRKPKEGEKILLVDDIITTGNTLARAAELLVWAEPTVTLYAGSLGYRPILKGFKLEEQGKEKPPNESFARGFL